MPLSRKRSLALALGTIAIGLLVHLGGRPSALRDVAGDALWAMMLAWWVGALWPAWPLRRRALLALLGCYGVEASQLLHPPWLDAIRRTLPGRLVLGSGFDPRDLGAYAAGVLAAALLEGAWARRGRRGRPTDSPRLP